MMIRFIRLIVVVTTLIFFVSVDAFCQTKVIIDLDIDSDVDDVSALAMLNNMHNAGTIELLGVIVTSDDSAAAFCAGAINAYFGNGKIPIAVLKRQPKLRNHSKYTAQITREFQHGLKSYDEIPDATLLYRQLLSKSPDGSVVIVTIGHLTNFQNLLKSSPDKFSRLNGKQLADKKVSKWLCMGGQFPVGKEANFYRPDPASTVYALKEWSLPVVFAGWEVGEKIKTGGEYLKSRIPASSPVFRAYQLYNDFKGRASWDQVAVLLLTKDAGRFFDLVQEGHCEVAEDGSNKWIQGKAGAHAYVKLKDNVDVNEISRLIDDMVIR